MSVHPDNPRFDKKKAEEAARSAAAQIQTQKQTSNDTTEPITPTPGTPSISKTDVRSNKDPNALTEETKAKLKDKNYRINHLYAIKDKNQNLRRFKRNEAQQHYTENKHTRNIILKSRQLGFTTNECIDMLDDTLWNKNHDSLVIAQTDEDAREIFDNKIQLAWEHFPLKHMYQLDADRSNKLKFGFHNPTTNTSTYSSISVKNSGRSGTYRRIHISEFGKICAKFPERAREIITGTIPTLPIDGQLTIESTAEGPIGYFYDMFMEAYLKQQNHPTKNPELRPTEFKAHFYNWQWDKEEIKKTGTPYNQEDLPEYFQKYQQTHNLTPIEISYYYLKFLSLGKDHHALKQEYPTTVEEAFEESGETLFDRNKLTKQKEYIKTPTLQGAWRIYEPFKPNHIYGLGGDPSEGTGGDPASAVLMDFTKPPFLTVATMSNKNTPPDMFAYELKGMASQYGAAPIIVERNNHGHAVLQKLKEIYPTHLIYKEHKFSTEHTTETDKLGWLTNIATKPAMMYTINNLLNEDMLNILDVELLEQLRTYPREQTNKVRIKTNEQDKHHHWDLVIALALALQLQDMALQFSLPIRTYSAPLQVPQNTRALGEQNQQHQPFQTSRSASDPFAGI